MPAMIPAKKLSESFLPPKTPSNPLTFTPEEEKKYARFKFESHVHIFIWKSYVIRTRRWRLLAFETVFSALLFLTAIFVAKPVFLTPIQAEPDKPMDFVKILSSLHKDLIIGYAPNTIANNRIMDRAAALLSTRVMSAATEFDLSNQLYNRTRGRKILNKVIWVLFESDRATVHKIRIRSTDVARLTARTRDTERQNPHLRAGFLAVQIAVSQALLEENTYNSPIYELSLVSMPVSPLMDEVEVRKVISIILLCYTVSLLAPVLETEAMVVAETNSQFKRALCIRNVSYSCIYIGWLTYTLLTALPICLLGGIALILIFRWIHLLFAIYCLLMYTCLMNMLAFIMCMYHDKPLIACIWTTLQTLLQTFLAEIMEHHQYDKAHKIVTFFIHMLLPPLGLINTLHNFALLQTSSDGIGTGNMVAMLVSWNLVIFIYFLLLLLMQRCIGGGRAIGGQVSWKTVIFKKPLDAGKLHKIEPLTGKERDNLEPVGHLIGKAISFNNVSKSVMGEPVLQNVTLDIYRNEFTMLFSERTQANMMETIENLLTGLSCADKGTINVLGEIIDDTTNHMCDLHMVGYCDRASCLIDELTVMEHINLFIRICLWKERSDFRKEYLQLRWESLRNVCDLDSVKHDRIKNLSMYYRAQLCWALAILLEPRIVFVPYFLDHPNYRMIIRDKILGYKKYCTIINIQYTSLFLQYADRAFVFDNKIVAFGGTPAYMFYIYGRRYRLRISLNVEEASNTDDLLQRVAQIPGANVRSHLGSLLIWRIPTRPTEAIAALIKELCDNKHSYRISSMNISLPDSEEVFRRVVGGSRAKIFVDTPESEKITKDALEKIMEPKRWHPKKYSAMSCLVLRRVGWKYLIFHLNYKMASVIVLLASIVSGVVLGLSMSTELVEMIKFYNVTSLSHGQTMTVEYLGKPTILSLRLENTTQARSLANAYLLSNTNATKEKVTKMSYIALASTESLTEYLVIKAIDSPQQYVNLYAYGMDISSGDSAQLVVQALYSPLHHDQGAASRSVGRLFMALLRHYTGILNSTIEIIDDPLIVDETPWMMESQPPLLVQLFLICTISHITMLPSMEHGLIRHVQSHGLSSSPVRYWFILLIWDLLVYVILAVVISAIGFALMYFIVGKFNMFFFLDLLMIPVMLTIYGISCIPQAYLFSLGPNAGLNSIAFIIVNIVLGETSIIAKWLYSGGNLYTYALNFMAVSPQFNMAYALVKIKNIFVYNGECDVFAAQNMCDINMLHKCCTQCGVLQQCFKRKRYLSFETGVLFEMIAMFADFVLFMSVLLLWEYKIIQRIALLTVKPLSILQTQPDENESMGVQMEKAEALNKLKEMKSKNITARSTHGEYLLSSDVSKKYHGEYLVRHLHLGLSKGQAVAMSGLKRHGRLMVGQVLAGVERPHEGQLWCMAKYNAIKSHHSYASNVSISCELSPLPHWLTVFDALELVALLRGVPKSHIKEEIMNYVTALRLTDSLNVRISELMTSERIRVHFVTAIIGAPPVLVLDEVTAFQPISIRRTIYAIIYHLRKLGHAIFISCSNVENHMPVTNYLAILADGHIFDIDYVDAILDRHSVTGYTIVMQLKDATESEVAQIFSNYFQSFVINDSNESLVNIQLLDMSLDWGEVFERMEKLKVEHEVIKSYIVCMVPIDYIYNTIIAQDRGLEAAEDIYPCKRLCKKRRKKEPSPQAYDNIRFYEPKYDITTLKQLPWSVIFHDDELMGHIYNV